MKLRNLFLILALLAARTQLSAQCYIEGESCADPSLAYVYTCGEIPDYDPDDPEYDILGPVFVTWSVAGGTMLSAPNAPDCHVIWDDVCETGVVTLDVSAIYYSSTLPGSAGAGFECTFDVHVIHAVDAAVLAPTGTNDYSVVECGDVSQLFFEANAGGCASTYVWEAVDPNPPHAVNTGWTIVPLGGTGAIAIVIPDGVTPATIRVHGQNCIGEDGATDEYTVQMGCIDHKLFNVSNTPSTNLLPEHLPVDHYIHVYPPAGGSISVFSSQHVYFKAGDEITLLPGFVTDAGAVFQAKIGPCTDCSGMRYAAPSPGQTPAGSTWNTDALLVKQGEFVQLKSENALAEISIWDISGTLLQTINSPGENQLNTSFLSSGMYIIRTLDVNGNVSARRLIVVP